MEIKELKSKARELDIELENLEKEIATTIFNKLKVQTIYTFDWSCLMGFSIKKISAVITDARDDDTERASKLLRENEIKHITRDYDVVDPISFQDMARKIKNSNWAGVYFTSLEAYNVFFESFKAEMENSYKNSIENIK